MYGSVEGICLRCSQERGMGGGVMEWELLVYAQVSRLIVLGSRLVRIRDIV